MDVALRRATRQEKKTQVCVEQKTQPNAVELICLEENLPCRRDAIAILHIVGESVVIVGNDTPGVVVGINTFVCNTYATFKLRLVGNRI